MGSPNLTYTSEPLLSFFLFFLFFFFFELFYVFSIYLLRDSFTPKRPIKTLELLKYHQYMEPVSSS